MKYTVFLISMAFLYCAGHTGKTVAVGPVEFGNVGAGSAAELYTKHCASCHGRDGRARTMKGKMKHARDLADPEWQDRVSDERIFNSIMNGKGKMPAYGKKLTEQEIDPLVSYVRALRK
jgi:mono/diheme cytochrome c family protein